MSLYADLQKIKSEEDVKDLYIRALNLKGYSRNLIDIQTKEVWFEAKGHARTSTYAMFTQLLHYVQVALNKDEYVPPFLCVIDTQKAAIMGSTGILVAEAPLRQSPSEESFPWTARRFTPTSLA